MYFNNRVQAGQILAQQLIPDFRYENCIVLTLNNGGAIMGIEIAKHLHCLINMIVANEIRLPREPEPVGVITSDGVFSVSEKYSDSDSADILSENREYIEEEKMSNLDDLNKIIGSESILNKENIKNRNVILVADGLENTLLLELAYQFLKPIKIEKLIVVTAISSVKSVDWMHVHADKIYCLNVVDDYISTNHYFEDNYMPPTDKIIKVINDIVLSWK